ncbi:MAG: hypothetical protein KDA75_02870, partial [Planctomycetaceae bacterium]|nr:hypothetical protein [Planctomycetaceae bacterium]
MRFVVDCIFRRRERRLILFASVVVMCVGAATAEEAAPRLQRVRHQVEGLEQTISGRIVVQAVDGGLLLETRDGQFVTVLPQNLVDNESTDEEFRSCTAEELAAQLQAEFGAGFEIVSTRRYVIATN